MRCITGDEVGLVKVFTIPNDYELNPLNEEAPPELTMGKVRREQGIQYMCQAKIFNGRNQIVVARNSGLVQIIEPYKDGKMFKIYKEFINKEVAADVPKRSKKFPSKFTGLFANKNVLVTCVSGGTIRYQPINSGDFNNPSYIDKTIDYASNLCCLRVHPKENNIFACGGRERDLSLWDINCTPGSIITKNKESKNGMIWNGKNVKSDFVDLRVPIWITDIQFLDEQRTTKILTGTKYHQVRLYDIKAQRRPVFEASVGHKAVVSLIVGQNPNEVIFSDTVGNIFTVDLRNGKNVGQYKGYPKGSFNSSYYIISSSLVTVSADRFLRVHKIGEFHEQRYKVYLNHKLTCVLVNDDDEPIVEETADLDDNRPRAKRRKTKSNE
ncbi:5624_t:CDS:10 [Dentiscutata heterogama]|uniref:5624_t:CDS:1 n=1 Tax=Dentiscutata heterogama TaxID=1316150 RepID=A0ACA9NS22_9GLOM|nr:5624_t:CDS:10 [Dentiscutata heterogama]